MDHLYGAKKTAHPLCQCNSPEDTELCFPLTFLAFKFYTFLKNGIGLTPSNPNQVMQGMQVMQVMQVIQVIQVIESIQRR